MTKSKQNRPGADIDPKVMSKAAQAEAMGVAWAYELQASLRADNRRPAGGWPGTMREASFRARSLTWVPEVGDGKLNEEQRQQVARTLYLSAKATWQSHSEREEPDRDVAP